MNQAEYIRHYMKVNAERGPETLSFNGLKIFVDPSVFSPDPKITYSSAQVLKHFPVVQGKRVLDLGTGSGILAVTAAKHGAKEVVAVDIDPKAVENAKQNVIALGFQAVVTIIESDLFTKLNEEEKFDVIIAQLPILDSAWEGKGISVKETFEKFFKDLDKYLAPGGKAYFNFASFGDEAALKKALIGCNRDWDIVKEKKFGVLWELYIMRSNESQRTQ